MVSFSRFGGGAGCNGDETAKGLGQRRYGSNPHFYSHCLYFKYDEFIPVANGVALRFIERISGNFRRNENPVGLFTTSC
jgi:hypothetical protein